MFWVTTSERVIDDHSTQADSTTIEKSGKERKDMMDFLNDRTWSYHSMSAYAMKIRTSVLNKSWSKLRSDMSPYVRRPFAAVPKATFSSAMAVMDKVG